MGSRAVAFFIVLLTLSGGDRTGSGIVVGAVRILTRGSNGELVPKADASSVVVYLTGFTQPPRNETPRISQKNKAFIPDVLPIVVGETVEFTNDDKIIHNVFSTSKARTFDLGKPRAGEARAVKFEQTGLVDVYCDIHEQMVASILVLPNRAFAVTGSDGSFVLRGAPPGRYLLFAWSRRSDPVRVEVEIKPNEATRVELVLTETKFDLKHLGKYGQPYSPQPDYPLQ